MIKEGKDYKKLAFNPKISKNRRKAREIWLFFVFYEEIHLLYTISII